MISPQILTMHTCMYDVRVQTSSIVIFADAITDTSPLAAIIGGSVSGFFIFLVISAVIIVSVTVIFCIRNPGESMMLATCNS